MREELLGISDVIRDCADHLLDLAEKLSTLPKLGFSLNDIRLTANFNLTEFVCRHCGTVKIDPELVRRLQALRDEVGQPVIITSGYRCPEHNRAVGGAEQSQHLFGRAADIYVPKMDTEELAKIADKYFADGGLGVYDTFVHVDTRGTRVRWTG